MFHPKFENLIKNRCDNAGENGVTRLATVRCPVGLAFDVQRQTCDWKSNVKNCDQLGSKFILNGRYSLSTFFHTFHGARGDYYASCVWYHRHFLLCVGNNSFTWDRDKTLSRAVIQ